MGILVAETRKKKRGPDLRPNWGFPISTTPVRLWGSRSEISMGKERQRERERSAAIPHRAADARLVRGLA